MTQQKGGRGKKAPYESKLMRVPEPIARQVEDLCQQYQDFLVSGGDPIEPPYFLEKKVEVLTVPYVQPPPTIYFSIQSRVRVRRADSLPQTQRTKRFISRHEGKCGKVITCQNSRGERKYSVKLDGVEEWVEFWGSEIESVEIPLLE